MNKLNHFFKSFKVRTYLHTVNPESLFLNFTVFLGFICVKDGEIILFVEFSGHGPFLGGFFFRSPFKVDVRAEALGGG